ncbi:hypothetical protein [Polaromonas sp. A23]|uniref:hypothetical protein n=1 Tax=Polaromonas sp. A23 TaxID=1944133 RepID=UPI001115738B|nr:hypothetical protein [Polaromonas sp. A23]
MPSNFFSDFFSGFAGLPARNPGPDDGTIQGLAVKHPEGRLAQKVHPAMPKQFFNHHPATGDSDGKDRRRRHENGQGKRSQVC